MYQSSNYFRYNLTKKLNVAPEETFDEQYKQKHIKPTTEAYISANKRLTEIWNIRLERFTIMKKEMEEVDELTTIIQKVSRKLFCYIIPYTMFI